MRRPLAVELARHNLRLNGIANAEVRLGDALAPAADRRFDRILTNLPYHRGHAADLSVAEQFIAGSSHPLTPGGRLYLVANRAIPYEGTCKRYFGHLEGVAEDRRYKVILADQDKEVLRSSSGEP